MTTFVMFDKALGEWFIGVNRGSWVETFYGYSSKEQAEADAPHKARR